MEWFVLSVRRQYQSVSSWSTDFDSEVWIINNESVRTEGVDTLVCAIIRANGDYILFDVSDFTIKNMPDAIVMIYY